MRRATAAILFVVAAVSAARAHPSCKPAFPISDGWWGADGGYSIPLQSGKTLWLFDDSFVGVVDSKSRVGTRMVSSTIGLGSCDEGGKFTVRYFWKGKGTGHPSAVFVPNLRRYKYWPEEGFVHGADVYVALTVIEKRPDIQGAFKWKPVGTLLARIRNVNRPFSGWKIDYFDLYRGKVFPGQSAVRRGGYIYLFSPSETGDAQHSPTFLTRFRESALDAVAPKIRLEYLAQDGSWKPVGTHGIDFSDARRVMNDPFAANSVWYETRWKRWVAVGQNPVFRSNQAVMRTAQNLEGPWSSPVQIYQIPDADPARGADKDTWCYQLLAHSEFRRGDDILLTYACNSLVFTKLVQDLRLYVPKAVFVRLPWRTVTGPAAKNQ